MNTATATRPATNVRYERYKAIVDFVTQQQLFASEQVKQACPDEHPAFVTRVVHELEQDGWIIREASDADQSSADAWFRWNPGKGTFPAGRWLDDRIFGVQVKVAPEQERPRERLLFAGAEQLKTSELLAILIRTGRPGESAVIAGQKLAAQYDTRLKDLPQSARAELKHVSPAVDKVAYCQIMAGIELGRRVAAVADDHREEKISSSRQAVSFCQRRFARLVSDGSQEEFHIVTLGTKNQVLSAHRITVGTLDASLVHPREVFRPAIKDAAASVILVHNHPSGDPTPSPEDLAVTRRLESAGEIIGIDVLDHIVVARQAATSIREYRG